jgi:hypothetical protein
MHRKPVDVKRSLTAQLRYNLTMIFRTTVEQVSKLCGIVGSMRKAGVDADLVDAVMILAHDDQGMFELMELWYNADEQERAEIIIDLRRSVDDLYRTVVK